MQCLCCFSIIAILAFSSPLGFQPTSGFMQVLAAHTGLPENKKRQDPYRALPCRICGAEEVLDVCSPASYACQAYQASAKEQHGGWFRDWCCFDITS